MDSVFFLDSLNNVWQTCGADDNDAVAFGPRGCARRVPAACYNVYQNDEIEAGWQLIEITG